MGDYIRLYKGSRGRSKRDLLKEQYLVKWREKVYLLPVFIGGSLLCAWLFQLRLIYIGFLLIGAVAASAAIGRACQAEAAEQQKFSDVNSYMQQFMSAMILHRRIAAALGEVYITFPEGRMHDTLQEMLWMIRRSDDPIRAEKQAFSYMQEQYPETQLRFIHDFALSVESRGGDFAAEMELLGRMRQRHEKRVEHCQSNMKVTAYTSVLLYVVMIFVCVLVQRMMPRQLSVLSMTLSQVSEVTMVLVFYFFLYMVIRNTAKGWMRQERQMSAKRAKKLYAYIYKWRPGGRARIAGIGKWLFGHRLVYRIRLHLARKEVCRVVPRWLFDVCLLMQKYNITVSITESLRTAPAILRKEIQKLLEQLRRDPSDVKAYARFCELYDIPAVTQTMRMFMAMQNGTTGDTKLLMEQLIEHNMNMLDEMDEKESDLLDAVNVRYHIYPMIPGAIVMAGYLFSMVMRIFLTMSSLI